MIASFADARTRDLFHREPVKRMPPALQDVALRRLKYLHSATKLDDLRVPPGNRLEALHGDRAGQYSIRINDQWRIVFRWQNGQAHEVQLVDYH